MITVTTKRQYAEFANVRMFVYINNLKHTQLKNIEHLDKASGESLTVRLIHSLIDEVHLILQKKLINSRAEKVTLKMGDAAGIALYKILMILPIPAEDFYFNLVRNTWIEILNQQIIR